MDEGSTCPECGVALRSGYRFCVDCGTPIQRAPVTFRIKPREGRESSGGGFQEKIKMIGTRVQQGMPSDKTNEVLEKAKGLKQRATGVLSPERAAEVISELVVIMVDVAKQLHAEMPEEIMKAVDLEASVNFVAFNVGITIDLESIPRDT